MWKLIPTGFRFKQSPCGGLGGIMTKKNFIFSILITGFLLFSLGPQTSTTASLIPSSIDNVLAPDMFLLGPEVQISTPSSPLDADRYQPAVAFNNNHQEYLVVWQNDWPGNQDIYAQRVSANGQRKGPWFAVSAGPNDRVQPSVTYNAAEDEYLVVWMYEASPDVYEIWGKIISWNGPGSKPEFRIIQWVNRSFHSPQVVWNILRNEYLVVWNAFDTASSFPPGLPHDIGGYRIAADGTIQNAGTPLVFTTYAYPHQVDLTYNVTHDQYFMVFTVVHTQVSSGNDIYGLRVSWNGSPIGGLIEIYKDDFAGGRKNQNHPVVATNNSDRYMVVWEHEYTSSDHDIYGREYRADGSPEGSYFTISSWTQDDTVPDLAAFGANKEWVAVWQREIPSGGGYSIHGFRWGSAGSSVYTYVFDVVNYVFVEAESPVIAAGRPGFLIVYEEEIPPGKQHIYGRVWSQEAIILPVIIKQ